MDIFKTLVVSALIVAITYLSGFTSIFSLYFIGPFKNRRMIAAAIISIFFAIGKFLAVIVIAWICQKFGLEFNLTYLIIPAMIILLDTLKKAKSVIQGISADAEGSAIDGNVKIYSKRQEVISEYMLTAGGILGLILGAVFVL